MVHDAAESRSGRLFDGHGLRSGRRAKLRRMGSIAERVRQAQEGTNASLVCRVPSGWVVMGDVQFLPGYCILLPDPVVPSLNDLVEPARTAYLQDLVRVGDAVLAVTGARRINYEILGNLDPELHAHVFPRFADEPEERRRAPVWFYDWDKAEKFSPETHGALRDALRRALTSGR
jgi:diadenosine tetraphosphate (Ap4A) HIT family hydrolase